MCVYVCLCGDVRYRPNPVTPPERRLPSPAEQALRRRQRERARSNPPPPPIPAGLGWARSPPALPCPRSSVPALRALPPGRRCARAPARCSVGMAVALGLAERGGQSRFNVRHVGRGVLSGAGAAEERSQRPAQPRQPAPPGPVSERAPPRRGSPGLSMRALGGVRLSARSALAVAPPSPAGAAIAA